MFQYQLAKTINNTDTKPTLVETAKSIMIHHFEMSQLPSYERKQQRNHNKVQYPPKKTWGFVTLLLPCSVPFRNSKGSFWKNKVIMLLLQIHHTNRYQNQKAIGHPRSQSISNVKVLASFAPSNVRWTARSHSCCCRESVPWNPRHMHVAGHPMQNLLSESAR